MTEKETETYGDIIFGSALFSGADRDTVKKVLLSDGCRVVFAESGGEIFDGSVQEPSVFLILDGNVRIYTKSASSGVLLNVLSKGGVCALASVFCPKGASPTRIVAHRASTALSVSAASAEELVRSSPELAVNFIRLLSEKTYFLNRKIASFTAQDALSGVAVYLLLNSVDGVLDTGSGFTALAGSVGIGRSSLYRALDELTSLGAISREKKRITILDRQKLSELI